MFSWMVTNSALHQVGSFRAALTPPLIFPSNGPTETKLKSKKKPFPLPLVWYLCFTALRRLSCSFLEKNIFRTRFFFFNLVQHSGHSKELSSQSQGSSSEAGRRGEDDWRNFKEWTSGRGGKKVEATFGGGVLHTAHLIGLSHTNMCSDDGGTNRERPMRRGWSHSHKYERIKKEKKKKSTGRIF